MFLKYNLKNESILFFLHLAYALAALDIKIKYRRSYLGAFWISISTGILIITLSLIFSFALKSSPENYLVYLTVGLITWKYIEMTLKDYSYCMIENQQLIKQVSIPKIVYVVRIAIRNIIIFLHNFIILLLVVLIYKNPTFLNFLHFFLAFVVLTLNLGWMGLVLAVICSRYRDISEFLFNILQIIFYLTPIIWTVDIFNEVENFKFIINFNFFYYLIEIVRLPLLGNFNLFYFIFMSLILIPGYIFSFFIYNRYKNKIVFWVQ